MEIFVAEAARRKLQRSFDWVTLPRRQCKSTNLAKVGVGGRTGLTAKRTMSPYRSGERSADWLKIKTTRRQEAVIVGFTAPRRSRPYFGALALAVRDGRSWRHVGHVGTGFSHAVLNEFDKLLPLRADASPFEERVKDEAATTWVRPRLVAEVKFIEWTEAGEMRHPEYLGLREDKRAEDVTEETERRR